MKKKEIYLKLLNQIIEDEKEYCFDETYMTDDEWNKFNSETREEAYNKIINYWKSLLEKNLDEFLFTVEKKFGDTHEHILHVYKYITEGVAERYDVKTGKYIKFTITE